ncbi:hypothetical protein [Streptomyces sp. NPDC053720]|uniref:hypothetical protein n=1 Tax=Streptomyces sp. NPDC053720 TaxID=3154855 RepID=UPI00342D9FC5
MRIAVLGADGPAGRHLTGPDPAASMPHEPAERRHVRTAAGAITTAVKPDIAEPIPIRSEG